MGRLRRPVEAPALSGGRPVDEVGRVEDHVPEVLVKRHLYLVLAAIAGPLPLEDKLLVDAAARV